MVVSPLLGLGRSGVYEVESNLGWMLNVGGVRVWSVLGPSRWSHAPERKVQAWWEYLQACLEERVRAMAKTGSTR